MPFNHLFVLLKKFSSSIKDSAARNKIDWERISWNHNIFLENILDYSEYLFNDPSSRLGFSYYANISVDDILNHPEIPWDWGGLSSNSNLLLKDILDQASPDLPPISSVKHPDLPPSEAGFSPEWNWNIIALTFEITIDIVLNNPQIPWTSYILSNSGITMEDIINHQLYKITIGRFSLSHREDISCNNNLTVEHILAFSSSDKGADGIANNFIGEWDWEGITINANITIEDILDHAKPDLPPISSVNHPDLPWEWDYIHLNDNISFEDIANHPELPWNWKDISFYRDLPIEIILNHLDDSLSNKDGILRPIPWDWKGISSNQNLTMEIIKSLPDKPWDWDKISENPGITFDNIMNNLKKPFEKGDISPRWNWKKISKNLNITIKDLEKSFIQEDIVPDWNWKELTKHPNISIDDILDHLEFPSAQGRIPARWDWNEISANPNLTSKFILDHPDGPLQEIMTEKTIPWNWNLIISNKFDRYNAAVTIQRFWRKQVHFLRWKRGIKDSNMAILYNPKIKGLEFLREKELVEREFSEE